MPANYFSQQAYKNIHGHPNKLPTTYAVMLIARTFVNIIIREKTRKKKKS
jgi:hypothetical protein